MTSFAKPKKLKKMNKILCMGIYRPCLALWYHFYNSPTMPIRQWNIYRFLVSSQQKLYNWAKFRRQRDKEKTKYRQTKKSKKHDHIERKETLSDVQMQYENQKVTNNAYTQGHLQGFLPFLKTTLNET